MLIRSELPGDAEAVRHLLCSAFPTSLEADLVERLREQGKIEVGLVAVVEETVVGHIAFSRVSLAPTADSSAGVGLAPVAVLPAQQRQGIGSRLIREGLAVCKNKSFGFVVVLGYPAYYTRFGFWRASTFGLSNEYGADEAFMVLELEPGGRPPAGTLVKYDAEFAKLDP